MEERLRSGGSSGVLVKNRNSLGCLIVKRKGDASTGDLGSSSSRKAFKAKKAKKRPRMVLSDSGSSDELLVPPRRRVGTETIRICNDLVAYDKGFVEESATCKPRKWLDRMGCNEDIMICRNGLEESERKRSKLDVFDFNEYDGINGEIMRRKLYDDSGADFRGRMLMESMQVPQSGVEREFEAGSSRHVDRRKNLVFDRKSRMNSGERIGRSRYDINSDRPHLSLLRDKFIGNSDEAIRLQGKSGVLKVMVNKKKSLGGSLRNCNFQETEKNRKVMRTVDMVRRSVRSSPIFSETQFLEKPASLVGTKNNMNSQKLLPTKNNKACDNSESEDSAASMKLEPDNFEACKSKKKVSDKGEDASCDHLSKGKEGKIRRGSGTEKQRLREKIRGMLLEAGWTIDYRPRRNRDYLDAVYINPSGTAYWSIIKAYDALQKQLNEEDNKVKPIEDGSFAPIADEILSQLTRKTRKKIEKEMKKKQRDEREIEKAKAAGVKKSTSTKRNADSDSHEEKLSSFIKQSGKSFKSSVNENGFASLNSSGSNHHLHHDVEKSASGSSAPMVHGRKNRKLGRCTLLVRGSNKGFNSETDGFVPYTGKRTLLFWLIDSGSVQLSQKVQYMNRRRTRAMLEGWITRDGIHCGCCSKILTVSKFEIHAGSKLRQPYQNIYLDSGISLLQCQIDVWNRLVQSEQIGFHTVDIDGDDPNDDTCGMCADGGDLICCDSCPSTFHQNCLGIEMLPPGDWHCPNCTCKFCGANENVGEEDNMSDSELFTCNLCEKKYHKSCVEGMDFSPVNANSLAPGFCGQKCKELFEHLQKYLGVRNDLEAGFSWSLIRRINENSETSHRGVPQKAECNSKLAVALTIMDECFLPIIDRRSGINLIRNVVYNCRSNFNRLNYGGFYTVVLERGDEIISAASIRFHGTKLAEMPYIGTRHIYRRQGMCRRLFGAIESALCSLKVEKLIIPAISELVHTWTTLFSFTPLEESLRKEMRSMNMLVFPGIDMLQKLIAPQEDETKSPTSIGMKQIECQDKQHVEPEVEVEKDADSSATHLQGDDDGNLCLANETTQEAGVVESGSQSLGVPLNDTSIRSVSLYDPRTTERILHLDSHSEAKLAGATSNDIEMQNEPKQSYKLKDSSFDASDDLKVQVSNEGTTLYDSQSGAKCISGQKCLSPSGTSHGVHLKDKLVLNFSSKDNTESLGVDDMDSSHKMNEKFDCLENVTASEENCNATEEVDENVNNSTSLVMGNKSDLDYQNDFETGNNPNIDPEAASDGMNREESALHASTDSSMVYALEGKFESRSI